MPPQAKNMLGLAGMQGDESAFWVGKEAASTAEHASDKR